MSEKFEVGNPLPIKHRWGKLLGGITVKKTTRRINGNYFTTIWKTILKTVAT